jgi:hypothetical protein
MAGTRKHSVFSREVTLRKLTLIALITLIAALAIPVVAADTCANTGQACCALGAAAPDNALTAQEKAGGWQLLFDGKTFNGWGCTDEKPGAWILDKDAMFYTNKGGGYEYTQKTYGNFELKADFMVDKGANSGIFFRWADLGDPVQTGFEMQVWDTAAKKEMDKHDCGALYDAVAPSENMMKPAFEWNTADIRCLNSIITITLNGKRVVVANLDRWTEAHKNPDGTDNKYGVALKDWARAGHIGFQAHGGKVWFKNVKVRDL